MRPRAARGDVVGLGLALGRRWYLVGPGLLLTIGLAWYLPKTYQRPFEARASLLLVDPSTASPADGAALNPYLVGNDSLVTTANVLAVAIRAEGEKLRVEGGSFASTVDVAVASKPPAPLLHIVVTAADEGDAARDIDHVVAGAKARLAALQSSGEVSSRLFVTAVSVEHNEPRQPGSGKMRPMLATVGVGLGLVVWMACSLDRRTRLGVHAA